MTSVYYDGRNGRSGDVMDAAERILATVAQVPRGRVCSYGDIAALAGAPGARRVGMVLAGLSAAQAAELPWHRIVARDGSISTSGLQQRERLEAEGVGFAADGRVLMRRHRWPTQLVLAFDDDAETMEQR